MQLTVMLRERVRAVLCPSYDCERTDGQECPGHAHQTEKIAEAVVAWLHDESEARSAESNPSLPNDLRRDIHVGAGEIAALADRLDRGEA